MFIEQSHDEVYGCLKGGSGNSGGKRLAISMVEEAWLIEKKEFAKSSILGKLVLQPHRNQSVVRQPTTFKSARPRISKRRFASQVDVNNDLSKPVTTHYLPKGKESACAKPHHVIASSESGISSKNMPRFSSNDMVHNHYLEEARKKTHESGRNSEPSVMPSARSQSTTNDYKPKPRSNTQTSRNWPASKSSFVPTKTVPIVEHYRNSRNFSDSKHFVCSTCKKCVFNANHDTCVTKFLNEVNSRAKVPSYKITQRYKHVEQIAFEEFNYLLKIDLDIFTYDIQDVKTYDEYEQELNNKTQEPGDGVTNNTRRHHNSSSDGVTHFKMASARTDSNADLEDSSYDGVLENQLLSISLLICLGKRDYVERIPVVENPNPQSTSQVLPSIKEYTPLVTYPEEVEETLGIPMEIEPLDEPPLEDLGLNTCNHDIPLSSREISSFDEPKPQLLPNFLPLDVNLGDKQGTDPLIKPHSPDSFRMKVVDLLTIHTPPSPHVTSFLPKDESCYYHLCVDDPKKHYGFKPGLLGQSGSLSVGFSNLEVIVNNFLKGLSLPVMPKEVENGRIKETRHLENVIQHLPFQHKALYHHNGVYR
ncbi:hypothetical protein Tco_0655022 [Tanacetum coccineum]|uniref:Uncharacterized protein n=1 Tax=Tanacetum coccineum TaxID=301880 RepID=A0ABQ4X4U5_9ASTR